LEAIGGVITEVALLRDSAEALLVALGEKGRGSGRPLILLCRHWSIQNSHLPPDRPKRRRSDQLREQTEAIANRRDKLVNSPDTFSPEELRSFAEEIRWTLADIQEFTQKDWDT
jgi:hypothetical protein